MQVQVIVKFVFVQVHISDEAFIILIVTIFEKFFLLYSLILCLSGCHSELHQNRYCSQVTVLVSVYCFRLVVEVFHQFFLCFSEMLLGCISFRPNLKCDVLDLGYLFVFLCSCRNFFVFCKNF